MSKYELSLPCTSELDCDGFDAVNYINTCLLPDENQIIGIESLIEQTECDISSLSGEIIARLEDQSERVDDGNLALRNSKLFIKELSQQVKYMQSKSEETERLVKSLTCDIQVLNIAKKNLTKSIITLNHLDILITQTEILRNLVKEPDFKKLLNPLQMINEILSNFIQSDENDAIKNIRVEIQDLERKLSRRIFRFFQRNFEGDRKLNVRELSEACEIVNILRTDVKKETIDWFVEVQIDEYRLLFESNENEAWLNQLDKRFVWLTRYLKLFDRNLSSIFPCHWNIPEKISIKFCEITSDSLKNIMNSKKEEISLNLLMSAVSRTRKFESTLTYYFQKSGVNFENSISSCYNDHFHIYVDSVDKNLMELIDHFSLTNKPPDPPQKNEQKTFIFLNSVDLFMFYKRTIEQCQLLDTSNTFLQIVGLFKKYLVKYAEKILEPLIPKKPVNPFSLWFSGDFGSFSNASQNILSKVLKDEDSNRFSRRDIFVLCCSIATSEYCLLTIEKLIEKVKSILSIPFPSNLEFKEEKEKFYQICSKCIQLLVFDMMKGCQPSLLTMEKIQWDKIKDVIDQSSYVSSLNRNLQSSVPWIRENLTSSEKYFHQFCNKFVTTFIDTFLETILKSRTLSHGRVKNIFGCEQLLLDIHSLKSILIMLPKIKVYEEEKAESKEVTPFTKLVVSGMSKAESYVKIAMTPTMPIKDFNVRVLELLPNIKSDEYLKILGMKNIRKKEEQLFLDNFKIYVNS